MELKDPDDTINRLIQEIAQDKRVLHDIQRVINSDPEFEGCSMIGGVKAMLRRYREERDAHKELDRQLMKILT